MPAFPTSLNTRIW